MGKKKGGSTPPKLSMEEIVALKRALDQRKAVRLNAIDVVYTGINFARIRYLEIELAITNHRIARLTAPRSFPEIVLYIAIGGVLDPFVAAGLGRAMRVLLKDNLTFVNVALKATSRREQVAQWRTFFKIPENANIKELLIPSEQFLNAGTMWGRLYTHVPEYVGSRIDEIVQLGPPKEAEQPPQIAPVAQMLIVLDLWVLRQRRTVEAQYRSFDLLLDEGKTAEVLEVLGDKPGKRTAEEATPPVADMQEQSDRFGNLVLLMLFAQAHQRTLGRLERVQHPTGERRDGSFVRQRIVGEAEDSREIYSVAIDELVHPQTPWPQLSFREWAKRDMPDHHASLEKEPAFQEAVFYRASVELLRCCTVSIEQIMSNPTNMRELVSPQR